ncbi:hypothetical protein HPP92_001530 [Vanilla planifolia]|uniref:Pentatricopeptide repeat-containing protein n=1 Tax=Vanilla planifolia TaxID=51239 RepID=A0A835VLM5_VANPL|nr:hypothetical protein HPP92_001530 [Vanilla planifolia]
MNCMYANFRQPQFISHRRRLEEQLSELHKCSDHRRLVQLHSQIFRLGLHRNPFVASKLIAAYSLCRRPYSAASVFGLVPEPKTNLFNTLIRAFAHNSLPTLSLLAFVRMQRSSIPVDSFTYPFLLKSFSGALRPVQLIHAHIVKLGFLSDIFVPNSLVDSYSKAGEAGLCAAMKLFEHMPVRDVVSWNSMIAALVRAGELSDARRLFDEMPNRDIISWNCILNGYTKAGEMVSAFEFFQKMPERNVVSWSTIVLGYCKKGDMEMAKMLFDKMPSKNLVTWTIMISAFAEKGLASQASNVMDRMEEARLELDAGAVVAILTACAESGLLGLGKRVHSAVKRNRMRLTIKISNAMIDMYSKCGDLKEAWNIFMDIKDRDLVSWNSMILGLAMHGHGNKALELFAKMEAEGIMPDRVTFMGVLCACTHKGLIKEARMYFANMEKDYKIVPEIEHYGCLVDLLGRHGLLMEAYNLAKTMPLEPNAIIWGSLLNACKLHNNVDIAEKVLNELMELVPSDPGNFAIICNIYASNRKWDDMAKARMKMKDAGEQKQAGSSWIELEDAVHQFTVGDRMHPQSDGILGMLNRLGQHVKQLGQVAKAC